jgi:hypothetical protein
MQCILDRKANDAAIFSVLFGLLVVNVVILLLSGLPIPEFSFFFIDSFWIGIELQSMIVVLLVDVFVLLFVLLSKQNFVLLGYVPYKLIEGIFDVVYYSYDLRLVVEEIIILGLHVALIALVLAKLRISRS